MDHTPASINTRLIGRPSPELPEMSGAYNQAHKSENSTIIDRFDCAPTAT